MDLMKLTFEKARSIVKELVRKNEVILILGEPGIGKTALVEQVSQELGYEVYYFNLNYVSKNDFVMLAINKDGEIEYKISKYLSEIINNEKAIWFLDEFNTASQELQSILLEITWKRLLFNKEIKCKVVLAGNDSFNSLINETIIPLETRVFKFKLIPDFNEWIQYIKDRYQINQRQMLYLSFIENFEKELFIDNSKSLNPRVHERILYYMGEFNINEEIIIGGWGGELLVEKYLTFKREIVPILNKDFKEIITEWKSLKQGQKLYLINKLIETIDEDKLIDFIENINEEEWGVMMLKKYIAYKYKDENEKILALNRLLKKAKKLSKFLNELINS